MSRTLRERATAAIHAQLDPTHIDELRAQGANFFGGVCINLPRHPAWGRAQETYGEDVFLLGRLGSAFVGGGRAVVVLERDSDLGTDPVGTPLGASVLDGDRVVCSEQASLGGPGQDSPLLVVDCPMRPTAALALRLAAGVDTVNFGAKLHG